MSNLIKENKMREMVNETDYSYEEINDVFRFIKIYRQNGYTIDMTMKQCKIFDCMVERGIV